MSEILVPSIDGFILDGLGGSTDNSFVDPTIPTVIHSVVAELSDDPDPSDAKVEAL